MTLDRDEYIEQAFFFRTLGERMKQSTSTQDLMLTVRDEVLSSTKLPLAIDFLCGELKHMGVLAPAMRRLPHYFHAFQTFVVAEAENERGRFDFSTGLSILEREAAYRAENPSPQGLFVYQFEALCRNRLGYDRGLTAMAQDPMYDQDWRDWILTVRRQIGIVDFAELLYVRSAHYVQTRARQGLGDQPERPVLFGEKEGKIALANRRKNPVLLFAALERHLKYPTVPRPRPPEESALQLPALARRLEKVETRLKLLEEEQKGGIDLTQFYPPPPPQQDQDESF